MRLHLVTGLLTLVCASGAHASQTNAPGCDAMIGVWEYVEPSAPGHAIVAKQGSKYLGIFVNTLPEPYNERAKPRTREKGQVDLYAAAGAWEYACEAVDGKLRLTHRWLYSSYRPQDVGAEFIIEIEMAGSQAKWWFIGADGKRGIMGAGRLIK
jgi:hypothetical protein